MSNATRSREGYHRANAMLVKRSINIDFEIDEAIRVLADRRGEPWGTVAREMLRLGLVADKFRTPGRVPL